MTLMKTSVDQRLPVELWAMILRLATELSGAHSTTYRSPLESPFPIHPLRPCAPYHGEPHTDIIRTKRSLVLVNTLFNELASPFLYETVVIRRPAQIKDLLKSVNKHARHVIRLDIDIDTNVNCSRYDWNSPALFGHFLLKANKLAIIHISKSKRGPPDPYPMAWLPLIASTHLPSLRCIIDSSAQKTAIQANVFVKLSQNAPNLEILEVETGAIGHTVKVEEDFEFGKLHTLRVSGGLSPHQALALGKTLRTPKLIHLVVPPESPHSSPSTSPSLSLSSSSSSSSSCGTESSSAPEVYLDAPLVRSANFLLKCPPCSELTPILTDVSELILEDSTTPPCPFSHPFPSLTTIGIQCTSCPNSTFALLSNRAIFPKLEVVRVLPKRGYPFEKGRVVKLARGMGPYLAETLIEEWSGWQEKFSVLGITLQDCDGSSLIPGEDEATKTVPEPSGISCIPAI